MFFSTSCSFVQAIGSFPRVFSLVNHSRLLCIVFQNADSVINLSKLSSSLLAESFVL